MVRNAAMLGGCTSSREYLHRPAPAPGDRVPKVIASDDAYGTEKPT